MASRLKNRFYSKSSNAAPSSPSSTASLNKIFDDFRDAKDSDTISDKFIDYLKEIRVSLDEPAFLVLAELLKAPTVGEFSRKGLVDGWDSEKCYSIAQMRSKMDTLRSAFFTDEACFKRVYLFTFMFVRSPNQKGLPLEVAIDCWRALLGGRFDSHLPTWLEFLEAEYKKSISKDTWHCLYDFIQVAQKDPALEGYDLNGAWPSILDDFVEYFRKKNSMDTS